MYVNENGKKLEVEILEDDIIPFIIHGFTVRYVSTGIYAAYSENMVYANVTRNDKGIVNMICILKPYNDTVVILKYEMIGVSHVFTLTKYDDQIFANKIELLFVQKT